jgi:hypothetical protein
VKRQTPFGEALAHVRGTARPGRKRKGVERAEAEARAARQSPPRPPAPGPPTWGAWALDPADCLLVNRGEALEVDLRQLLDARDLWRVLVAGTERTADLCGLVRGLVEVFGVEPVGRPCRMSAGTVEALVGVLAADRRPPLPDLCCALRRRV